jgi:hypothetical protein
VTYFLKESKQGYCQIFATAMVIMCRQAGIPARWVTGFSPGEYNEEDGFYHIRFKDMHAWVEAYFPGYGWIPFDPTPGGDDTPGMKERLVQALTNIKERLAADGPSIFFGLLILVLSAYLVKNELISRLRARRKPTGSPRDYGKVADNYRRMSRVLARSGYPRHPAVTPMEYAREIDEIFGSKLYHLSKAVGLVTADFVEARYSGRTIPDDRVSTNGAILEKLIQDLKVARRAKLLPRHPRKSR